MSDPRCEPAVSYAAVHSVLSNLGLMARGGFQIEPGEFAPFGLDDGYKTLIMVGNAGPGLWASLSLVLTYDHAPHALDRWTRRVLEPLAERFNATVVFPFEGPAYLPFQRWARRAEPVFPSPTGPLIHSEFGMWHAYRGALLFNKVLDLPAFEATTSPCESCVDRPCMQTCPVNAFSTDAYDVPACSTYLGSDTGSDCLGNGCAARRACPVGQRYVYAPHQAQFHMQAFLDSRSGR